MHIVFITSEYPTPGLPHGGVGTFVKYISSKLVQHGFSVSVVGFYKSEMVSLLPQNEEGVTIYRLPASTWKSIRFIDHARRMNRALNYIHQQNKIDVIETAELGLAFIRKMKGTKYVIRMHGGHHFFAQAEKRGINRWKGFQEKRSFEKADALVGVSQYVVDHTASYMGFNPSTVPVIFNPVNVDKFYKANPAKAVKGRIVFIGTVCEKKGIRQLVMAMPTICKESPEAHLVIAGRDWFFPSGLSYIKYLNDFIDSSVTDKITFLGPISNTEVPSLIESAEVCVYPSHMEAMPIAWLEVLAMGKAFVGSNTGPGDEVIKNGFNGLTIDPYSSEDIASKVIELLSNNDRAISIGENAHLDFLKRFDINTILQKNVDFYTSINS